MAMVYKPRPGFVINTSAQVVGNRIEELKQKCGGSITKEQVLEDARDPASPIHDEFIWDDQEAAERQRLGRARYLLNSYEVVYVEFAGAEPRRAFVNVHVTTEERGSCYVSPVTLLADDEARASAFREAHRLLNGLKERLRRLEVDPGIIRDIEKIEAKLKKAQKRKPNPDADDSASMN